jgi:uncharacterized protein YeaO (DUF488 family)
MGKTPRIRIKRAYADPAPDDGARILVDRLWPRGLKKESARLDAWLKDIAPSDALRKWFGHDPDKWPEFRRRYSRELAQAEAAEGLKALRERVARGPVTLVYAAADEARNNAVVLAGFLDRRARKSARGDASTTRSGGPGRRTRSGPK